LVERALQLNPNHPGWFWFAPFFNAYRKRDYNGALNFALKINLPGFHFTHLVLAAAYGQLGQREEAGKAVQELLRLKPDIAMFIRPALQLRYDPQLVEDLIDGLGKAGLDIPDTHISEKDAPAPSPVSGSVAISAAALTSGATRADEGFWVAVLPFRYAGKNDDLKALAEGLSEEVITGLSRFSYLRVVARGSTAKYSSESGDVRAIGKELGARYVMEGSLRQAGSKLRLAVQLADTVFGTHLWAETYERAFAPESFFEVQDDLVPRIVSTVADQYGVLPRSMGEVLRNKSADALTPHEAVLRTFSYFSHIAPEEHAIVRAILERAVREAPDHADSWAMLSMMYRGEFAQGYNAGPNPLDRALAAAQRAVDLAPTHALGHYALATVYFFRKDMIPFRVEAERAFAFNPLDASVKAYLGLLIASSGEWDRGCQLVETAMELNPNCPGYFYFARCCNGYRQGKYEEVLEGAARVNMPTYYHIHALRAAALGQLGRHQEAHKAVQDLLVLRPGFAATARQEYAKWYDSELIEQIVDGLRKAGLEIPGPSAAVPPEGGTN
jgi:adenylate cyclase